MSRIEEIQTYLAEMYANTYEFVTSEVMDVDLRKVLCEVYGEFEGKLMKKRRQLVEDDCPVVVAGASFC